MVTQKVIPHLWFDKEASEAAAFYVEAFGGGSKLLAKTVLHNTPSEPAGDTEIVTFELLGQQFMSISAGPVFKLNPSISFFVNFDPSRDPAAKENLDKLWAKLSDGGKVLMDLGEYPFSKHYGWVNDKYGVSWQLILTDPDGDPRPAIVPSLLFTQAGTGKAAEAIEFYLSVFKNSEMGISANYEAGQAAVPDAKTMYADFRLENLWLAAMDSNVEQDFAFNEAVSIIVNCETQEEINYYWEKLSAVPESEQCGWLKDKYRVSWQITPQAMNEMLENGTREQIDRLTQATLPMHKLDIAELQRAYDGE